MGWDPGKCVQVYELQASLAFVVIPLMLQEQFQLLIDNSYSKVL